MRPLRHSVLYMPADRPKLFEKVEKIAADSVIFDLEDAVAPHAKIQAREALRSYFSENPNSRKERIIRINGVDTEHFTEDLLTARKCMPDAIAIPKLNTAEDARKIRAMLDQSDTPKSLQLWGMLETAQAIINHVDLTNHHKSGLECLILGANDLTLETSMKAGANRGNHLPWMVNILMAGKAGGVAIIDSVYNHFTDEAGLAKEARQAAELGFDGKSCIHPKQIEIINKCFAPADKDIQKARNIKAAFDLPENQDKGAIQLDGAMVERLHLIEAEKLLTLYHAIKTREQT